MPVGNEYDGLVFNASIRAKQPMIGRAAQHAYTSTHGMHTVNRRYARTARRVPTSEQMMIIAATAAGRLRREPGKRPYRG